MLQPGCCTWSCCVGGCEDPFAENQRWLAPLDSLVDEKKNKGLLEISETRRSKQNNHLNFGPSSLPHPKVMVKGEWLLQFIKQVKVHHRKPWTQRPCFRPHLTSCARTACWAANSIAGVLEVMVAKLVVGRDCTMLGSQGNHLDQVNVLLASIYKHLPASCCLNSRYVSLIQPISPKGIPIWFV